MWQAPLRVKRAMSDAFLPSQATPKSAGYDLTCRADVVIPPRCKATVVDIGITMEIPEGTYGRIAGRSGLSLRTGLSVLAGVIDQDYRGSIGVMFQNLTDDAVPLKRGDKIAQIIFERICHPNVCLADELSDTQRGAGGFGSTDFSSSSFAAGFGKRHKGTFTTFRDVRSGCNGGGTTSSISVRVNSSGGSSVFSPTIVGGRNIDGVEVKYCNGCEETCQGCTVADDSSDDDTVWAERFPLGQRPMDKANRGNRGNGRGNRGNGRGNRGNGNGAMEH
ncbi:hypothetical protein KHV-MN_00131 [Cyprinid herpesvirus 3]|nr:hypothetical protein KHV-MN_00131 [Cyprinid herpesvirus 3]